MTEDQRQQCKQQLLQVQKEHKALEKEFAAAEKSVMPDQSNASRMSRIQAMQDQHIILEESRHMEMKAEEIEGGLRRVESEDFGTCFYCEEQIDFKILEIDPTITRCMKCIASEPIV